MQISKNGLSKREAGELLKKYGPNELVEKPGKPLWLRFLEQFKDFMIIVLIVAAVIAALLGETADTVLIIIVIMMHGILGFIEEYKAEQAFAALKKLVAQTARVVRDNEVHIINVREIVPNDLVLLDAGDRIPADGIVIEGSALSADESALTGESLPVSKNKNENMFMGTVVVSGKGAMIVKNTGTATEMGRIAALVQEVEEEKTPIEADFEKLGKQIALGVLFLCTVIFIIGIARGFDFFEMFIISVSLAVAAIPEGLPAVVAIVLAMGVQRMAKRNAIIRKLKAVETLGCTTVIATDKTGTLTRNEMVIKKVYVNNKLLDVSGTGYVPKGEFRLNGKTIRWFTDESKFMQIAALCNTAYLKKESDNGWQIIGDPTEGALLVLAGKANVWREQMLEKIPEIIVFPFDPARKRMTTIHGFGSGKIAYTKGAPETILKLCSSIEDDTGIKKLSAPEKDKLEKINNELTAGGYRTLALAWRKVDGVLSTVDKVERDFIFVGIVAMMDAPRDEVRSALKLCKSAGIKVIMITGDHPLTAKAVAGQLGIPNGIVLTGDELERINDKKLGELVEKVFVYARVSPADKLRIVDILKRRGHVVAVTGDGVNDAPALKKADIGIAMGITGTDVAKESADMILADDNFATIVAAVEKGRGAYDNIKKTLAYLVSGNIAEVAIIFIAMLIGLPLPLIAIQILWINLVTDGLPAVALSVEPIEKDVMKRPPRARNESIWKGMGILLIDAPIIITGLCLGIFIFTLGGNDLIKAQTMIFTMLMMAQKMLAFNARSLNKPVITHLFSNHWLVATASLTLVLHLMILYIPSIAALFHVVPLSLQDWIVITGLALLLFVYMEIRKMMKALKS